MHGQFTCKPARLRPQWMLGNPQHKVFDKYKMVILRRSSRLTRHLDARRTIDQGDGLHDRRGL